MLWIPWFGRIFCAGPLPTPAYAKASAGLVSLLRSSAVA